MKWRPADGFVCSRCFLVLLFPLKVYVHVERKRPILNQPQRFYMTVTWVTLFFHRFNPFSTDLLSWLMLYVCLGVRFKYHLWSFFLEVRKLDYHRCLKHSTRIFRSILQKRIQKFAILTHFVIVLQLRNVRWSFFFFFSVILYVQHSWVITLLLAAESIFKWDEMFNKLSIVKCWGMCRSF